MIHRRTPIRPLAAAKVRSERGLSRSYLASQARGVCCDFTNPCRRFTSPCLYFYSNSSAESRFVQCSAVQCSAVAGVTSTAHDRQSPRGGFVAGHCTLWGNKKSLKLQDPSYVRTSYQTRWCPDADSRAPIPHARARAPRQDLSTKRPPSHPKQGQTPPPGAFPPQHPRQTTKSTKEKTRSLPQSSLPSQPPHPPIPIPLPANPQTRLQHPRPLQAAPSRTAP